MKYKEPGRKDFISLTHRSVLTIFPHAARYVRIGSYARREHHKGIEIQDRIRGYARRPVHSDVG